MELTQAVSRLLDGIHLGEVDLDELRLLAGQALQGGGVQRRFQELEIPAAPFTSTTAEGDDSAVVRGATAPIPDRYDGLSSTRKLIVTKHMW